MNVSINSNQMRLPTEGLPYDDQNSQSSDYFSAGSAANINREQVKSELELKLFEADVIMKIQVKQELIKFIQEKNIPMVRLLNNILNSESASNSKQSKNVSSDDDVIIIEPNEDIKDKRIIEKANVNANTTAQIFEPEQEPSSQLFKYRHVCCNINKIKNEKIKIIYQVECNNNRVCPKINKPHCHMIIQFDHKFNFNTAHIKRKQNKCFYTKAVEKSQINRLVNFYNMLKV